MTRFRASLLVAALVLAGALAYAGLAATPADRADRLAAELRCPVCQGLSVKDSPAQTAREMYALIQQRVAEGRTDVDIRREFRDSYGDWVSLAPGSDPLGLIVWVAPAVLVLIGGAVAWSLVRTREARTA